jgi:hypothetical protein
MCLKYILVGFTPFSFSLFPFLLLRTISNRFHSSIFIYEYKIHSPYSPSYSPFPYATPPTGTHPGKDIAFSPILFKIKCMLIVLGGFTQVLQVCFY